MRQPRLNALRTFETVGRQLSFSRAAEELNITQAAVSQQIRHLEADLGRALFYRHHRRITLTDVAQRYLPAVQDALAKIDAATVREFGSARKQQMTIRCTTSIATQWLAPHVSAFQMQHPEITLNFHTLETSATNSPAKMADIEIFCTNSPVDALGATSLFDTVITPFAAPRLVGRKLQQSKDILGYDLIHVVGYDEDWHRWFDTYLGDGETVPEGLSADSSSFAIDAALRGDGIHLGRSPFIEKHLQSGALVAVFDRPLELRTTYYLRIHKNADNAKNIHNVSAWIQGLAKDFRNSEEA